MRRLRKTRRPPARFASGGDLKIKGRLLGGRGSRRGEGNRANADRSAATLFSIRASLCLSEARREPLCIPRPRACAPRRKPWSRREHRFIGTRGFRVFLSGNHGRPPAPSPSSSPALSAAPSARSACCLQKFFHDFGAAPGRANAAAKKGTVRAPTARDRFARSFTRSSPAAAGRGEKFFEECGCDGRTPTLRSPFRLPETVHASVHRGTRKPPVPRRLPLVF